MSTQIKVEKLNSFEVKPLGGQAGGGDKRPIKGADLLPDLYGNLFIASRKNTGKTTLIGNIIKHCVSPETTILLFSSTIEKDPIWQDIREWCDEKEIPLHEFIGIKDDDGVDRVQEIVDILSKKKSDSMGILKVKPEDEDVEGAEAEEVKVEDGINPLLEGLTIITPPESKSRPSRERKKKKPKYRVPEYMLILDDLSDEIGSKSVAALLKKNRHLRIRTLISSQYPWDLAKDARKQIDSMIMFGQQEEKQLSDIHKQLDIPVSFDMFLKMYRMATPENDKYSFFYFDPKKGEFRKKFNTVLRVAKSS